MDTLPIDTSNPAVRDFLALVRLQVLTPLSLLLNIATVLVCAFIASPSIGDVARLYPTSITPNTPAIGAYVAMIWLGQIGYCILLVGARKPETKRALIKGVGLSLPLANLLLSLWVITWVLQYFLAATILQGLLLLVLLFTNMVLLVYHPPDSSRPLDTALIHAPLRFFLILPLSILFALSLFVTLHLTYVPPRPDYSAWDAGAGTGVLLGTNLLGLIVIAVRRDIVWCVAAVWIDVAVWTSRTKPPKGVYITAILFTALLPLALIFSMIYARFYKQSGRIRLLGEEGERPGNSSAMHRDRTNGTSGGANGTQTQSQPAEIERGPREVEDETWG